MSKSYNNPQMRQIYFRLPTFIREGFAYIYSIRHHRRRFGGAFQTHLAELKKHSSWTAEDYASDQLLKLRLMLFYAESHCVYYHELFHKIGFKPDKLYSLEGLWELPVLEKEIVRSQSGRLLAFPPIRNVVRGQTGGTTGSPLKFLVTEEANQRHYATQWFHMSWAGIRWGERWAHFGGHLVGPVDSVRPPFWILDRHENELIFSSQHMTPNSLPDYTQVLEEFQPAVICGYPSSIYLLALHLIETGSRAIRPKGVFTWAETTLEYQRQAIEKAFDCRVYSSYGNGERTGHLLQCECGNFHVVPETCVVEVLDAQDHPACPGEIGELVCTSLVERAMPLIRYRTGDTAIAAEDLCSCGRTTPIVSAIEGRTRDFIIGRNGRTFIPHANMFTSEMLIKEAQFVQDHAGAVCIRLVPRIGYGPEEQARLTKAAYYQFGNQLEVTIQIVDAIPRTKAGKYQFVVSHLQQNPPYSLNESKSEYSVSTCE